MNLTTKDTKKAVTSTDLLVVFGLQGKSTALPKGVRVPALATKAFLGEFREARLTDATGGPAKRVLQVGLGKGAELDGERVRRAAAIAAKKAEKTRSASATLWVDPQLTKALAPAELAQSLAEGAVMGSYSFKRYKSKKNGPYLKRMTVHGDGRGFSGGVKQGQVIAEANLFARELQDTPANLMRPRDMVAAARKVAARAANVTMSALDEKAMTRLKMGSLLSVSRGSSEPAYLIHLKYRPKKTTKRAPRKVCLVGKGLTFDAGGISLKPAKGMEEMKYDMSGGAAVIGVFHALAKLQPAGVEVHGLVATSENLPDGKANKPGDLVTAMNGVTIEVLNTDAEGRLILADALAYADKKIGPDAMIDLATLTGAIVHGLGHELSAAMGNDDELIGELVESGKRTGELVWHMPLLDCHKEHMKGAVGDLKNVNPAKGAGSLTGGAFLSNFVGETPWVHMDIAGSAWGADERDYQGGSSGTGVGVRLLVDYLTH